jgi:hypothetical protein
LTRIVTRIYIDEESGFLRGDDPQETAPMVGSRLSRFSKTS